MNVKSFSSLLEMRCATSSSSGSWRDGIRWPNSSSSGEEENSSEADQRNSCDSFVQAISRSFISFILPPNIPFIGKRRSEEDDHPPPTDPHVRVKGMRGTQGSQRWGKRQELWKNFKLRLSQVVCTCIFQIHLLLLQKSAAATRRGRRRTRTTTDKGGVSLTKRLLHLNSLQLAALHSPLSLLHHPPSAAPNRNEWSEAGRRSLRSLKLFSFSFASHPIGRILTLLFCCSSHQNTSASSACVLMSHSSNFWPTFYGHEAWSSQHLKMTMVARSSSPRTAMKTINQIILLILIQVLIYNECTAV